MDATTRFDTQIIGAWPAISCYFRRLDLASVIDEAIPWEGNIPLETLVEILIANRLLQPKAMYKTGQWAEKAGLADYYGRAKSGRKDVRQIQAGLNVTGDGGVPVGHLPLDGNASESPTHLQNLKQLAQTLGTSDFLYIGDSKTDTAENLLTVSAGGGRFLCAGAMQVHWQDKFRQFRDRLQPVDYFPKSQAHLPAEQRDQYEAFELWDTLKGDVNGKKVRRKYRVIFVWSEAKARQEAETRTRHLDTIREEFLRIQLQTYSCAPRDSSRVGGL